MTIAGVRHVGFSVNDVDRSAQWYKDVLGFIELFRETNDDRASVILKAADASLIVGLNHHAAGSGDAFTPLRTGLDHLCLLVSTEADLEAWVARLDEHNVSHSGILEMATGPILNFKDPDGIALALATPPRAPQ
jgi:catechol 2,3-dioxygenase-like lactoylglutathione lyase family enzyme